MFTAKRVYEPAAEADGYRVLVDRIWPRGISKERAHLDRWLKDVAPSTALRERFGHVPERFADFRSAYLAELAASPGPLEDLRRLGREHEVVTLVYSAHDTEHNQAVVLLEALEAAPRE